MIIKYLSGGWIPNDYETPENSEEIVVNPTTKHINVRGASISNVPVSNDPEYQSGQYNVYENDQPLSGTDPIGEMYVAGAALNPWLKYGLGKIGLILFQSGIDLGRIGINNIIPKSKGVPIKFNDDGIKNVYELFNELPEGNPLKLHMQRLINSGRNLKTIRIFDISKDGWKSTYSGLSNEELLAKLKLLKSMGAAGSRMRRAIYLTPEYSNNYSIISHELDHAMNVPLEGIGKDVFDFKIPKGYDQNYFNYNNNWELAARGSQIKDWLNKSVITIEDLKNAASNYVKQTGIDNAMTEFFSGIKDYGKMAEWITKYSTAVSPVLLNNMNNDEK